MKFAVIGGDMRILFSLLVSDGHDVCSPWIRVFPGHILRRQPGKAAWGPTVCTAPAGYGQRL